MTMRVKAGSTIYVTTTITAPVDLTDDPVAFAFTQDTDPVAEDWINGTWLANNQAILLVTTGTGADVAKGNWSATVRVIDDPQTVLLPCGRLVVE